eukprot:scaffold121613_cov51-Attheya_sp.AAC.1
MRGPWWMFGSNNHARAGARAFAASLLRILGLNVQCQFRTRGKGLFHTTITTSSAFIIGGGQEETFEISQP